MNARMARARRKEASHRKHPLGPRGQQLLEEARAQRNKLVVAARAKMVNALRAADAAYRHEVLEANKALRDREAEIRRAQQEGRLGIERVDP